MRIGKIIKPHGVRGEIKVFPTTDDVKRYKKGIQVILKTKTQQKELLVEQVKFFKNLVIVKLESIDSMDQAEELRDGELYVTRDHAIELNEGEYFICDVIDSEVVNENDEVIGTLVDVMSTKANDIYVIKTTEGRELLLPVIEECVLNVDIEHQRVKVHVLPGLL